MELKNWLNNVRLGAKNDKALVVHGPQASGKTVAIRNLEKMLKLNVAARYVGIGDFGGMFFLDSVYKSPLLVVEVATGDYTSMMLADHIKPLLTDRDLRIDRQGKSTITVTNNVNVILHTDALFVEQHEHDRRFVFAQPLDLIHAVTEIF